MSNYPPGAEYDKKAPYNQKELPCRHCDGSGMLGDAMDEFGPYTEECSFCDGTGIDLNHF